MSYGCGLPCLKCSDNPKPNSKNSGNTKAIANEKLPPRASLTENVQHENSHMNVYMTPEGVETGDDLYNYIEERFAEHNAQRKANGQRALKSNVNKYWARACTPAKEFMEQFKTYDEKLKVLKDLAWIEVDVVHEVTGAECTDIEFHFDEMVPHIQSGYIPTTHDGKWSMKDCWTPENEEQIHRLFIERAQAAGYDLREHTHLSDLEEGSEEWYAEKARRREECGMSANEYARQQAMKHKEGQAKPDPTAQLLADAQSAFDEAKRARDAAFDVGYERGQESAKETAETEIYEPARRQAKRYQDEKKQEADELTRQAEQYAKDIIARESKKANELTARLVLGIARGMLAKYPAATQAIDTMLKKSTRDQLARSFNTSRSEFYEREKARRANRERTVQEHARDINRQKGKDDYQLG